jgi:hypothetical protein
MPDYFMGERSNDKRHVVQVDIQATAQLRDLLIVRRIQYLSRHLQRLPLLVIKNLYDIVILTCAYDGFAFCFIVSRNAQVMAPVASPLIFASALVCPNNQLLFLRNP